MNTALENQGALFADIVIMKSTYFAIACVPVNHI